MLKPDLTELYIMLPYGVVSRTDIATWLNTHFHQFTRKQSLKVARILSGWLVNGYCPTGAHWESYQESERYLRRQKIKQILAMVQNILEIDL